MMIAIIVVNSILILYLLNFVLFRRSFMATFVETVLRLVPNKRYDIGTLRSAKVTNKRISYKTKLKGNVFSYDIQGMPVYELTDKSGNEDYLILYLHGGAYASQPMVFQWNYARKLANKLGARVVVPLYPLALESDYHGAHNLVTILYKQLVDKYGERIILMGDSAGGGLAATLTILWQQMGLPTPTKLILLSPWLDISLNNPDIPKLDRIDPMLNTNQLKLIGDLWRGDTEVTDYLVSPIYSPIMPKCPVYIFAGTREILYPDAVKYYEILMQAGADAEMYVGVGLNHVYPMYPIPEAHKAFKQITSIIKNSKD